jgi:pimeloyl-ACP methyl ester carboxylesterase
LDKLTLEKRMMKSNSIYTFQKSVVVILLLNLFLSMIGVSAQNSQVDCSKLAFSPNDLPTEIQKYVTEQNFVVNCAGPELIPTYDVNTKCSCQSGFSRDVRYIHRYFFNYEEHQEELKYTAEKFMANLYVIENENQASSVYSKMVEYIQNQEAKIPPNLNEKYGDESAGWITSSPVRTLSGTEEGTMKRLVTFFRIGTVVCQVMVPQWYEYVPEIQLNEESWDREIRFLDPLNCEDFGLKALRNWSERLLKELSVGPPTPPVTNVQCGIKIDGGYEKVALDDLSQLTFKGTVTSTDPAKTATSVDLVIYFRNGFIAYEKDLVVQNGNSFNYVFKPKAKNFADYELRSKGGSLDSVMGRAELEACFKDSSGNVLVKCSKEFYLVRPPVVILHGIWSSSSEMEPVEQFLRSKGFEYVYRFDYKKNNNGDINQIASDLPSYLSSKFLELDNDKVKWSRFDIVAHSAGGLVARVYINNNPNHVRKLVTIATPHDGSPAANILAYWKANSGHIKYDPSSWKAWNREDLTYDDRVQNLKDDVRYFAKEDLFLGDYGIMVEQLTTPHEVVIGNNYLHSCAPSYWLQIPEEGRNTLPLSDVKVMTMTKEEAGTFIKILNDNSHLVHSPLKDVSLLCIAGCMDKPGFFIEKNDGIVTVDSGIFSAKVLNQMWTEIHGTDHSAIKTRQDTLFYVVNFLNRGLVSSTHFAAYSPVRVHVYDEDERHTGFKSDGTFESQIPDSEYFEEGDASHVIAYGRGEYRVVYEAYDSGNATFSITRQVADEGVKVISYDNVEVKAAATYTVTAKATSEAPMLKVDLNEDGVADEEIKPSDYQYYPPQQVTYNNDEDNEERTGGFSMGTMTIAGVGLILILIVALLVYRNRTTTAYVPAHAKEKKLTQQIQQAPTTLVCPSCGSQNPSNAKYCIKCSKPIKQSNYCEECGKEIPLGSTYCPICGDKQ